MITFILPTRDRADRLRATLRALGRLSATVHDRVAGAEVIVLDNASDPPASCPTSLDNGWPLRLVRLERNHGAAARNIGAELARGEWLVMLDDDSHPLDTGYIDALLDAPNTCAAIGAEITLPCGRHEDGGLPEVFIGCGVAIRREEFLRAGGYDPAFNYYAEEYDLAARLISGGWRIVHDARFQIRHEKTAGGRDMNLILQRLVRNNGWVAQRYAPSNRRQAALCEVIERYARVGVKECASPGFACGCAELLATLEHQDRRPMTDAQYDRFTGLAHVSSWLARQPSLQHSGTLAGIVAEGKNAWAVRKVLDEMQVRVVATAEEADVLIVGTLSPGPMLDAWLEWRSRGKPVVTPCAPPANWQYA